MRKVFKPARIAILLAVLLVGALIINGCATFRRGEVSWHESHDVIIIGSGISGYVTYLSLMQAAQDAGRNIDILFIEQMGVSGGVTRLAGGANFNNMRYWHGLSRAEVEARYNLWMRGAAGAAEPVEPLPHQALNILNPAAPYPDFNLLHPIMASIREAWIFIYNQFGGSHPAGSLAAPSRNLAAQVEHFVNLGGGPGYMLAFETAGNALGGSNHLRLNHTAVELHQENVNGEYVGTGITLIDNMGRRRNHRADVIVFATGSFSQNQQMKEEFSRPAPGWPQGTGLHSFILHAPGFVGADGSGINMLRDSALPRPASIYQSGFGVITGARPHLDLGAVADARVFGHGLGHDPIAFFQGAISSPLLDLFGSVLVNADGRRTLNEFALSAWNAKGSHHMHTENRFPYWRVFSSHPGVADGQAARLDGIAALEEAVTFRNNTGVPIVQRQRVIEELVSAPSIQELAALMFPNPADAAARDAFIQTVTEYDAWVAANAGSDPHAAGFHPAGAGKTLEQAAGVRFNAAAGPFYAVRWYPSGWDTAGGVRTNSYGQVLDTSGQAIPNVFAVGGVSNRFYFGETYVGGSSLTFYPPMARISAARILRDLGYLR